MSLNVITNNQPRQLLHWSDLTDSEKSEFDYFDTDNGHGDFVRYRGFIYHLDEFMRVQNHTELHEQEWQGYECSSVWSGVLVKYTDDSDYVIMGRYYES